MLYSRWPVAAPPQINPKLNLFYSNTDSAAVNGAIPAQLVGNGQLKLEYLVKRALPLPCFKCGGVSYC
jgi:hypothetical protein